MSNIIVKVSFKLNDESLLDDWKVMSAKITADLADIKGFISRESAKGEDGLVYCIVQWDSLANQVAFRENFESSENFAAMMADFARIVDMETLKQEMLEVI